MIEPRQYVDLLTSQLLTALQKSLGRAEVNVNELPQVLGIVTGLVKTWTTPQECMSHAGLILLGTRFQNYHSVRMGILDNVIWSDKAIRQILELDTLASKEIRQIHDIQIRIINILCTEIYSLLCQLDLLKGNADQQDVINAVARQRQSWEKYTEGDQI